MVVSQPLSRTGWEGYHPFLRPPSGYLQPAAGIRPAVRGCLETSVALAMQIALVVPWTGKRYRFRCDLHPHARRFTGLDGPRSCRDCAKAPLWTGLTSERYHRKAAANWFGCRAVPEQAGNLLDTERLPSHSFERRRSDWRRISYVERGKAPMSIWNERVVALELR